MMAADYYSQNPQDTKFALMHRKMPSSSSWVSNISQRLFNEGPISLHVKDNEFRGAGVLVVDFAKLLYMRWDMPYTLVVICMQCDDNIYRDTFNTKCELDCVILQRHLNSIDHYHQHHHITNNVCVLCFEGQYHDTEQEPWQLYDDDDEELYFRQSLVYRSHYADEEVLRSTFLKSGRLALLHRCCSDVMVVRMTQNKASLMYCIPASCGDTLFRILCLQCGMTIDAPCSVSQLKTMLMINYVLNRTCSCRKGKKK